MTTERNDFKKLAEMIKDMKFTMFTTVNLDGTLHSRPMATLELDAEKFDGTLWFFSRKSSFKNMEIESEQDVNLAYSEPSSQRYVSVSGKAFLSQDEAKIKELWNPTMKAWFPEGLNDKELSLIGVRIESADLWDSPPAKMVQLVGFVKAAVTGKPYETKKNSEHIDLRH